MATHDYIINNQSAPDLRADLNNALLAIVSQNSGSSAPGTTYANMLWYDTSTNEIKKRNEANSAWVVLGTVDEGAGTFTPTGLPAIASQAQAEAGTDNTTLMTPLRMAQSARPQRAVAVTPTPNTVSSVNFTGVPSWARMITVLFNEVSINGSSGIAVKVGTSGGIASTGYVSTSNATNQAGGTYGVSSTTSFQLRAGVSAADVVSGTMTLFLISGNVWVQSHAGKSSTTGAHFGGGTVSLASALDRVQITTVNGIDLFDAGSVNIMWE